MSEIENKYLELNEWDKVEFLIQLEFQENDDKWDLLNSIIRNIADYDLARVQALKILTIGEIPRKYKNKIAESIDYVINNDEDYDVRNYALSACVNFIEYNRIEKVCVETILDINEDIDLRYNAFAAILKISRIDFKKEILVQLLNDSEFGKSAKRNLEELQ